MVSRPDFSDSTKVDGESLIARRTLSGRRQSSAPRQTVVWTGSDCEPGKCENSNVSARHGVCWRFASMQVSIACLQTEDVISPAKEARTITVWRYLEWRCVYWQGNGASELHLYKGETLFQLARPLDTFDVLERSASWHNALPIPEIRSGRDRRAVRRGGRRAEDSSEEQG